jgi:hypothetical protein
MTIPRHGKVAGGLPFRVSNQEWGMDQWISHVSIDVQAGGESQSKSGL